MVRSDNFLDNNMLMNSSYGLDYSVHTPGLFIAPHQLLKLFLDPGCAFRQLISLSILMTHGRSVIAPRYLVLEQA